MNAVRILVYGAGVLGCNLASDFQRDGKDVTLLARGAWADQISENGLTIENAFLPGKKTCRIPVIRELKADDRYDVIFACMRCTQLDSIMDALNGNVSENIVLVGNNPEPEKYVRVLGHRNVMFAFYMAAGHREKDRVVSFSLGKITIGQLKGYGSNQELIGRIFAGSKLNVTYQPNMGDYLLCHAAFVTPIAFACYYCEGDLKKISRDQTYLNRIIDANIEGYRAIEKAGHEILPESDRNYTGKAYRRLCYAVYKVMCSTKIGQICASDHALNAVEEMRAMNAGLKKFFGETHADTPVYLCVEQDAERHLRMMNL